MCSPFRRLHLDYSNWRSDIIGRKVRWRLLPFGFAASTSDITPSNNPAFDLQKLIYGDNTPLILGYGLEGQPNIALSF